MTRPPQKADYRTHWGLPAEDGASLQHTARRKGFQRNVRNSTYAESDPAVPFYGTSSQHPHNPLGHSVAIHRTAPTSCNAANSARPISAHLVKASIRFIASPVREIRVMRGPLVCQRVAQLLLRRTPASARNTKALAGSPSLQRSGEQSSCTALYRIGFEKHARSNARSRRAMHDCADRPLALFVKHFGRSKPQRNLRRLSAVQCGQPLTRFQASANRQPNHSRSSSK
jgi:hypothetical protein